MYLYIHNIYVCVCHYNKSGLRCETFRHKSQYVFTLLLKTYGDEITCVLVCVLNFEHPYKNIDHPDLRIIRITVQ